MEDMVLKQHQILRTSLQSKVWHWFNLEHYFQELRARGLKAKSPLSVHDYKLRSMVENQNSNYNLHLGDEESTYQAKPERKHNHSYFAVFTTGTNTLKNYGIKHFVSLWYWCTIFFTSKNFYVGKWIFIQLFSKLWVTAIFTM